MRKISALILLLIFVLTQFCGLLYLFADSFTTPEPAFQRGMCFAAWSKDCYKTALADDSLAKMKEIGVEWVAVITTWYQKEYSSTIIKRREETPSDSSLEHAIDRAHKLGMKVMLKPHVDLINQTDTLWRADIGFSREKDWKKWFNAYRKFIVHYGRIAEKKKVEIFCIGTELTFAATAKPDMWQKELIPAVRAVYSGPLIYAANWQGEYDKINFWNDLDYAGIDAYFPLTGKHSPSYEDIKDAWGQWLVQIEEWQKKIGKPVIFTEIGYCSSEGAATRPWELAMKGRVDLQLQADCYKAVLEVFWNKPWFYGIYWWQWSPNGNTGGRHHRMFTPQNKPAQEVLSEWYKKAKRENTLENIRLVRYTKSTPHSRVGNKED